MVQKNNCYKATRKHEIVYQIYKMPVRVLSTLSQCKLWDTAFLLLSKELETNLLWLMSTEIVLLIQLAKFDIEQISLSSNNNSLTCGLQ